MLCENEEYKIVYEPLLTQQHIFIYLTQLRQKDKKKTSSVRDRTVDVHAYIHIGWDRDIYLYGLTVQRSTN